MTSVLISFSDFVYYFFFFFFFFFFFLVTGNVLDMLSFPIYSSSAWRLIQRAEDLGLVLMKITSFICHNDSEKFCFFFGGGGGGGGLKHSYEF